MPQAPAYTYSISVRPAQPDSVPALSFAAHTAQDLLHAVARLQAVHRYAPADAAALACALHTLHDVLRAYPHDDILAPLSHPVAQALRRLENCTPPPAALA